MENRDRKAYFCQRWSESFFIAPFCLAIKHQRSSGRQGELLCGTLTTNSGPNSGKRGGGGLGKVRFFLPRQQLFTTSPKKETTHAHTHAHTQTKVGKEGDLMPKEKPSICPLLVVVHNFLSLLLLRDYRVAEVSLDVSNDSRSSARTGRPKSSVCGLFNNDSESNLNWHLNSLCVSFTRFQGLHGDGVGRAQPGLLSMRSRCHYPMQ